MKPSNFLIAECVEEIIFLIDEQQKPMTNQALLRICHKIGDIRSGGINPHLPHEIAETALNSLIQRKYAAEMLPFDNPAAACAEILKPLCNRLPTQSWRSGEQNLLQQFSTPPAIAYLTAYLINLCSSDEVLEPSAGTGSLAVWASRLTGTTRTHVNEIDSRRRELLACLGFTPTAYNAEFIHDYLPPEIAVDALMMNPPFSSSGGRTATNSSKFGFRHVASAFERLKPEGKFAVILGDVALPDSRMGSEFWRKLSDRINLKAVFKISGREYYRNGTSVNVNVFLGETLAAPREPDWAKLKGETTVVSAKTVEDAFEATRKLNLRLNR